MATQFDINAKPFDINPIRATRPAQGGRPQNMTRQAARPQNMTRQAVPRPQKVQVQERPAKVQDQVEPEMKQQSDILPFVVSTKFINVGNEGLTKEQARPTQGKPFSMEEQFQALAKETNLNRNLRDKWTMWLSSAKASGEKELSTYMNELEETAVFSTIPQFCEVWNQASVMKTPCSKIVVFKKGIKPVWEDPDNCKGGRFVIRGSSMEETLAIFLVIATRVMTARLQGDYNDLCGVILHAKSSDQLWIQLWNRDATDYEQIHRFKRYLNKLTNRTVAYQAHPDPKNRTRGPKSAEATQTQEEPKEEPIKEALDLVNSFLNMQ
jgi:translation initiation factor 4E